MRAWILGCRVQRSVLWAVLLGSVVGMGACSSSPSPLPPPPIASYGQDGWDADDVPPSYGGVGAPGIAQPSDTALAQGPDAPPRTAAPGGPVASGGMEAVGGMESIADAGPLPDVTPDVGAPLRDTPLEPPSPELPPNVTLNYPMPSPGEPTYAARPFRWHASLSDAQADARAQGKLILTLATRPNCGLCERFKNQIAPAVGAELSEVAVGYVYDAAARRTIDARSMYTYVRRKLPGASLMPLVGFVTHDVSWVHGFFGSRSVAQFRGDIAMVRGMVPALARPTQPAPPYTDTAPLADVTQPPQPSGPPEAAGGMSDMPGPTGGITSPQPPPPPIIVTAPQPGRVANPGVWMPETPDLPGNASMAEEKPWLPPALASEAGDWGQQAFRSALSHMRGKRYGAAQATLKEIIDRYPGTAVAREASKGTIAIYNARRIDKAPDAGERARYEARAKRDLNGTIWSVLFS